MAELATVEIPMSTLLATQELKAECGSTLDFPAIWMEQLLRRRRYSVRFVSPLLQLLSQGKTSNLNSTYHLLKGHPEAFLEVTVGKGKKQLVLTTSTLHQTTLAATMSSTKLYLKDGNRAKQLVSAIAYVLHLLWSTAHQHCWWDQLLTLASSSRSKVSVASLNVFCQEGNTLKVHCSVVAINDCTITTQLWTCSHQQCSYITLTVHFVDQDFKLQSLCVKTLEVPQGHCAESLRQALSSMFQDWNIIGTYNGQNIVNAVRLLGIQHFPCVVHTLQLGIIKALGVSKAHTTIARCKKLVEHFKCKDELIGMYSLAIRSITQQEDIKNKIEGLW